MLKEWRALSEWQKSKVAVIACGSYDESETCTAVARGIELLGGVSSFTKPGEKIVVKPNLLSGTDPALCIITHPSIFIAVAKALQAADVQLSWGDSPAIGGMKKHARRAGYTAIAEKLSIPEADFDTGEKVTHHSALISGTFPVARGALNVDGLVSVCKLKTQGLTRMTGAVKNQLGCVPGLVKSQSHARYPLPADFSAFLVDINTFLRPRLYVMDAVMAMEGNGPNSGDPTKLGVVLLSRDPVALDACACYIMHINPEFVPTCVQGEKALLGTYHMDRIEIVGDDIERFVDRSFRIVRKPPVVVYGTGLKRFIKDLLAPRPVINSRLCTKCGECVKICPANPKALSWQGGSKKRPPAFESLNCIRCYCCQETCPSRAIGIKTRFVARVAPFISSVIVSTGHRINHVRRTIKARWRKKADSRRA